MLSRREDLTYTNTKHGQHDEPLFRPSRFSRQRATSVPNRFSPQASGTRTRPRALEFPGKQKALPNGVARPTMSCSTRAKARDERHNPYTGYLVPRSRYDTRQDRIRASLDARRGGEGTDSLSRMEYTLAQVVACLPLQTVIPGRRAKKRKPKSNHG